MRFTSVRSYRRRLGFEASNMLRVDDDTYESDPGGRRISRSERDGLYVFVALRITRFARGG